MMELDFKILLLLEYQSREYRHVHHTDECSHIDYVIFTSNPEHVKGKIRDWINNSKSLDEENRQIAERLRDEGYIVLESETYNDEIVEFIDPYEERVR